MDYALIENKIVANIIYLHPMNADDFLNAVPINGLPVRIGDTYDDGKFYRDGVEVTSRTLENIQQTFIDEIVQEAKKDE